MGRHQPPFDEAMHDRSYLLVLAGALIDEAKDRNGFAAGVVSEWGARIYGFATNASPEYVSEHANACRIMARVFANNS